MVNQWDLDTTILQDKASTSGNEAESLVMLFKSA